MFKKLFSIKKKENKIQTVGGDIKYFGLTDWWLKDLTEEERQIIRDTYKPFGMSLGGEVNDHVIDEGEIGGSGKTKFSFISVLISWFQKPEYFEIAKKIINLAEQNIDTNKDILDEHFYYLHCIKVFYRNRDNDPDALNKAIEYCKKQISISSKTKIAFLNAKHFGFLPGHTGYKQLAIIYEKQKEYQKALDLTKQALEEGWDDECQKRIDRLEKKLKSNKI